MGLPNDETHQRYHGQERIKYFQGSKELKVRVTYLHRTCSWTLLYLCKGTIPSTSRVALQKSCVCRSSGWHLAEAG